jgi:two-component system response regulator AtoC
MPFVFGSHQRMRDLERRAGFIARSGLPVLIEGASGTGKEALAELLHGLSGKRTGLTKLICRKSGPAVYPGISMVEGAADLCDVCRRIGGTLFLKNVHLLSPVEQEQLLVALEEADSHGGKDEPVSAIRIVSSATESLESFVTRGEWNPALYHRLSVYRICLPPLCERREDIPELFTQMVKDAVNGNGAPPPATPGLLEVLTAYDWPGNIRELQNIARNYVVTGHAEEIIAELGNRSRLAAPGLPANHDNRSLRELVRGASQKLESEIILRTLERHRWNRRRAAQSLQISYRSLLYKMKNCNLRIQLQTEPDGKRDL